MQNKVKKFEYVGVDANLFFELKAYKRSLRSCKMAMTKYVKKHGIEVGCDRRIRIYHRSDIKFPDEPFFNDFVGVRRGAPYYYRNDSGVWLLHVSFPD